MINRRLPCWLIWAGGPLLVLALLVAVFRWDWLIPLAEARASAALGRPVTIQHLHVRLGRTLGVTVEGIRIANPQGFADEPPLALVPRLEVAVELLPLLFGGHLVIPRIALDQPMLTLLANAEGHTNYLLPIVDGGGEPPTVHRLEITGGTGQVRHAPFGADFQLSFATEGDTITGQAEGRYANQRITGRFTGGALLSLADDQQPWPLKLELAHGPTRLKLEGGITQPLVLAGADLALELAGPNAELLGALVGVPLVATPSYRLTGQLAYAEHQLRLTALRVRLGRTDIDGAVTLVPGPERPLLTANLTSSRLDLTDFGGFIGSQPGRRDTPNQSPEQRRALARAAASPNLLPNVPLILPRLGVLDLRLTLRAHRLDDERVPLDNLAVDLVMDEKAIRLEGIRLGVGRGNIAGGLVLTPRPEGGVTLAGVFDLHRLDVARLLQPLGVGGSGTLGGVVNITGSGVSVAQVLGSGNGAVTVAMVGGNISSLIVDLSGLQFGRALLSALGLPARTNIGCLIGDFVLQRGVLQTRTLVVDTESSVIQGTGTINLAREVLDLRLRTASKGFSVGSLPTTIGISGRLKDPSILPDIGELAVRGGLAAGLGALALPLALLPTIQLGVDDSGQCEGVVGAARRRR